MGRRKFLHNFDDSVAGGVVKMEREVEDFVLFGVHISYIHAD